MPRLCPALAAPVAALALLLALPACQPDDARPADLDEEAAAPAGPLPETSLYQLDATWESHRGDSLRLADLRGEPALLAMVFTNCASACPLIVEDMKAMARAMPEDVAQDARFVLVSLDPARDTVAAMARFASAHGLGNEWTLLRGSEEDVQTLAALLNVRYREEQDGQFAHSNLISVLAPDGEVVAQQEGLGTDPAAAVDALEQALAENR